MSEAFHRLVLLMPYAVGTVARFCRASPVGYKVLRTFDRALRRYPESESILVEANRLVDDYLALPSALRSVNQLRLARRIARHPAGGDRVDDIARSLSRVALDAGRDRLQRRCAAWYLAELSARARSLSHWNPTREALRREAAMADLAQLGPEKLDELAAQTRAVSSNASPRGDVDFVLLDEAPATTKDGEALLQVAVGGRLGTPPAGKLNGALVPGVCRLLREALRTPCPIRWRTITETFRACEPGVQTFVIGRLCALTAQAGTFSAPTTAHLVQRAFLLMSHLGHEQRSLDQLKLGAKSRDTSQRATAIWGIGDVLLANPQLPRDEGTAIVEQTLLDTAPAVRQAAIHSIASIGNIHKASSIEKAAAIDPETHRWAVWAYSVMRTDSL
jgi:hypothetical protein